jgi:hypothetical protein
VGNKLGKDCSSLKDYRKRLYEKSKSRARARFEEGVI